MLIRCGGCEAVHEAALAACPGCGRCPACGRRRVAVDDAAAWVTCPACRGRTAAVGPCACGHPDNPAQVAAVERAFGVRA